MIRGNSVLGLVTARGGSKGIVKKNICELGGKPLIAWTIEAALKSEYIDRLILSSNDKEIINIAKSIGCEVPFVRPEELAQDDSSGIAPVLHAIETLSDNYEYVVLLQPTSPFRKAEDIDGCIRLCIEKSANSCVSITEVDKSPHWMYHLNKDQSLDPLLDSAELDLPRQDLPKVFVLNGAVYVARSAWLMMNKTFMSEETIGYQMPISRSIDIDTGWDLMLANKLITEI